MPFLPFGFGIVLAVWRQFNGEFGTAVATAPDGLRLRSGLVQTTAETIRPGRVQAVRLVEPLLWRAFGLVPARGGRGRGAPAPGEPVGGPAPARADPGRVARGREQMLARTAGRGAAAGAAARPAPARWKAPLTYHFLGWDGDDRYVVASRGRVCRKTTWVPLEKVQSIRWVQGPVQRRLGLASVRLDVAGRRVTASIQDRDAAEAQQILARLPDLARAARSGQAANRA